MQPPRAYECLHDTVRHIEHEQRRENAEAEQQFRRITGHSDLAKLAIAIERELLRRRQTAAQPATEETAIAVTV